MPFIAVPPPSTPLQHEQIEMVAQQPLFQKRVKNQVILNYSIAKMPRERFLQANELSEEFIQGLVEKHKFFNNINLEYLIEVFLNVASSLMKLAPNSISVELTSAQSIFFFSIIKNNNIYFEIFFNLQGNLSKAVLNIFAHKEQQLSISGDINDMLIELWEYLNHSGYLDQYYPHHTYDLSRQTFTSDVF